MAFGKTQGDWSKIYYFDTYTKKDEEPHFKVQTKNHSTGKYEKLDPAMFVDGYINGLYFKDEKDYDGNNETNLYLKLFEGKDLYVIRIKFFMVGRSIMNSLASLVSHPVLDLKLTIRLYRKKDDSGEWRNRVYVGFGPKALDWYMTPDEMKSLTEKVVVNNKTLTDTRRLDAKLTSLINEAIEHVKANAVRPAAASHSAHPGQASGESIYSDPAILDEESDEEPKGARAAEGVSDPAGDLDENFEPEDDLPF